MSLSSDAHELLGLLAYIYLEHNRPEKTAILLQALHSLALATPREQTMLALSLLRTDKPQAALDVLDRLALNDLQDATCHLIRSQALHALNRRIEAQASMQTYLRLRTTPSFDAPQSTPSAFPQPTITKPSPA